MPTPAKGYTTHPLIDAVSKNSLTSPASSVPGNFASSASIICPRFRCPSTSFRISPAAGFNLTIPSGYSRTWQSWACSHCSLNPCPIFIAESSVIALCPNVKIRGSIVYIGQGHSIQHRPQYVQFKLKNLQRLFLLLTRCKVFQGKL